MCQLLLVLGSRPHVWGLLPGAGDQSGGWDLQYAFCGKWFEAWGQQEEV